MPKNIMAVGRAGASSHTRASLHRGSADLDPSAAAKLGGQAGVDKTSHDTLVSCPLISSLPSFLASRSPYDDDDVVVVAPLMLFMLFMQ